MFDSPKDILLWDTGHQSYVHKLVTGRRARFSTLRQMDGMSGYPNRAESEHDWVENSHASTILSYAHGLALAESATGSDRRIIAVIGDGSMTGGMAYEGLNNLGVSGSRAIIILNDNGRSYAPTVSRLSESLARLRLHPSYVKQQAKLRRLVSEMPVVGEQLERGLEGAKAAIREMFEPPAFFEQLGVRYTGPVDGHDIPRLEHALRNAAEYNGPIVVHVLTQKGRGYAPAENDPIKRLHDTSEAKPGSYTAAFTEALIKEAEERPEVVAMTAAMPDSTGLLPFAERFPDRCVDVGIAEQHAVTAAAGMAMGGLRPVVAIYSTFLTRAVDQVNLDVGLHDLPVVFCVDRAGITGDDGPSHHGVLDLVLLSKVPSMTILAPSSYAELQVMLHDALDITTGPVAIRWPKTMPPDRESDDVGVGLRARRVRAANDPEVCLLALGKLLEPAIDAAQNLADDGRGVSVWDIRCAKTNRSGARGRRVAPPCRGDDGGRLGRRRYRVEHRAPISPTTASTPPARRRSCARWACRTPTSATASPTRSSPASASAQRASPEKPIELCEHSATEPPRRTGPASIRDAARSRCFGPPPSLSPPTLLRKRVVSSVGLADGPERPSA